MTPPAMQRFPNCRVNEPSGTGLAAEGVMKRIILILAISSLAGGAMAQTSPCAGAAPVAGEQIRGPILHVVDGQTLCVARGIDPSQWSLVRLEDAPSSANWGELMSVAFGKDATCVVAADGAATCQVGGRSIGAQVERAKVRNDGASWRRAAPSALGVTQVAAAF